MAMQQEDPRGRLPVWVLVGRLTVLAGMVLGVIFSQYLGDRLGWHLPWYFIHEVLLIAVPMGWLLVETFPSMSRGDRLAFVVVSGFFVLLGSMFELVAIQNRYWWFYEQPDVLTGIQVGAIGIEEFVYYPAILNIPILLYVYLQGFTPRTASFDEWGRPAKMGGALLGAGFIAWGIALLVITSFRHEPALDTSILPAPDAAGALRYVAGPAKRGWTVLQLISIGVAVLLYVFQHRRLVRTAFILLVAIYVPYCFYLELMACGRGWWVWNGKQTSGIFTWVLPLDSYLMYLTGATLPPLFYELLRPVFAQSDRTTAAAG
jgi:hypothetical protein